MTRLICGPPGSGKTRAVLEEVRRRLARGARDFRLLAPTATMAEHLGHGLARDGFVYPPELVSTLTRYLAEFSCGLTQAPAAALRRCIEAELARAAPAAFSKVAAFPGFTNALARLMEDFSSAGCGAERLARLMRPAGLADPIPAGFCDVFRAVEKHLRDCGWVLRGELLALQAERIRAEGVAGVADFYFDGFLSMPAPELEVVAALAAHAGVTVTLPEWDGAAQARQALAGMGFAEQAFGERRRARPREVLAAARSLAEETREVARRILEEHAAGRPWREMGVLLRSAGAYEAALRLSFERFGIPARFYFAQPAAEQETIRYLTAVVEALLSGWEHEMLLAPLASPLSGVGASEEGDRLEFALREKLPGRGLDALMELAGGPRARRFLDRLARLDAWRTQRAAPAEWAARAAGLRLLVELPPPVEPFTHAETLVWRAAGAALDLFDAALLEAAGLMDPAPPAPFAGFWESVRAVLRLAEVRVRDARRDVVHVLDVYEARQWELPVVFVCGLLEKEFPRYHGEDPVFDDAARRRLAGLGVCVRTAGERQREERFLFEIAVSRATGLSVLSYPRFNAKGDENLRSFFLDEFLARPGVLEEPARPARPAPRLAARVVAPAPLAGEELRAFVAGKHQRLAPTSIEAFLQCPFQFFARKTLELEARPERPEEWLNLLLQGQMLHDVLAELALQPQPPLPLLNRIFERTCARERLPEGYRREAVRLELERNLSLFVGRSEPSGWPSLVEQPFEMELDGTLIRGRIDRIDAEPGTGRAVVIDYKYASRETVHKNVKAHQEGRLVQGGLYMLALERSFGYEAAGMAYCGLRGEVSWEGWHAAVPWLPATVTNCAPDVLRQEIDRAVANSRASIERIRAGEIAAAPADPDKCRYCEFADICRVESAPARRVATEGGE
ncbi:MAG: PD-(D/E)XK nuclease family protein [Acidobacteria bacterium]|nr:PD-(D/E)XK nuclease family protein [Acidobacteriota bacterium]